jgi:SAM-dependent methyltransferase
VDEGPGLRQLRQVWERHGRRDAFRAVLTRSGKRRRWDEADFFATGGREVERVMAEVARTGPLPRRELALDFGCGVGRLTQALASHFERVVGVDVAASMVEAAGRYNRFPERVSYVVNPWPGLHQFADDSFDFVVSLLTLQHIPPSLALGYVAEVVRVLRPGGAAVLQVVTGAAPNLEGWLTRLVPATIRRRIRGMGMYAISVIALEEVIRTSGAHIALVQINQAAGPRWVSAEYIIRK